MKPYLLLFLLSFFSILCSKKKHIREEEKFSDQRGITVNLVHNPFIQGSVQHVFNSSNNLTNIFQNAYIDLNTGNYSPAYNLTGTQQIACLGNSETTPINSWISVTFYAPGKFVLPCSLNLTGAITAPANSTIDYPLFFKIKKFSVVSFKAVVQKKDALDGNVQQAGFTTVDRELKPYQLNPFTYTYTSVIQNPTTQIDALSTYKYIAKKKYFIGNTTGTDTLIMPDIPGNILQNASFDQTISLANYAGADSIKIYGYLIKTTPTSPTQNLTIALQTQNIEIIGCKISTPTDLMSIGAINDPNEICTLINDIDLTGVSWQPISGFKGTLEGNDFTIRNLTLNQNTQDSLGLFNVLEAQQIRNLNLENFNIQGKDKIGALAAIAQNTSIYKVEVKTSTIVGGQTLGGLVGMMQNTNIDRSRFTGQITSNLNTGTEIFGRDSLNSIGGLVAFMDANSQINLSSTQAILQGINNIGGLVGYAKGSIFKSNSVVTLQNLGTAAGTESDNIGGITGQLVTGNINQSQTQVNIVGNGSLGGLVGMVDKNGQVFNSYATGQITDNLNNQNLLSYSQIGGLIGYLRIGSLTNTYADVNITNNGDYVGGLIGYSRSKQIYSSYFPNTQIDNGYGISLDPNNLQQIQFVDWDFGTIWSMSIQWPILQ